MRMEIMHGPRIKEIQGRFDALQRLDVGGR